MHVQAQNAAVIVRILTDQVQFEMFEVLPKSNDVTSTTGKLLCSYPGPAIQVSSELFSKECFLQELASFLVQMDADALDSAATTVKAGSTVREVRESVHPKYISELLVGILRGFGQPASVDRITKRIADEVLWKDAYKPWRRSPLWLVIRVALQTSLDSNMYKSFMLFFHAYIINLCIPARFPSETLHLMRVKLARRLSKLGSAVPVNVYKVVYSAAKSTETLLLKRWSSFQAVESISMAWEPEELDTVNDVSLTLKHSRPYLLSALRSTCRSYSSRPFVPSHRQRLGNVLRFSQLSDGRLTAAIEEDKRTALADFEFSVERYLGSWVDNQDDDDAADVIASCIEQYFDAARDFYGADPEDNSVMILTVMNLWMALDKLTTELYPLMKSYSPGIPRDFLHPLLLHHSDSLRRATFIEEYISKRHQGASNLTPIFSDDNAHVSSFAVQYFLTSPRLQRLKADITQRASKERNQKRAELEALNDQWESLTLSAAEMTHYYEENYNGDIYHRKNRCEKCQTEKAANRIKIDVHEWPLPQADAQAQLVIFELSPPRAFSAWRQITYKILFDMKTTNASNTAEQPGLLLDTFSGLRHWAVRHPYHRITLGSTTKSFHDQTHYKKVQLPAEESEVLLNNGLSFKFYDRNNKSWAEWSSLGSTITRFCTPPIPVSSPYAKLHSFVSGTHHTSNEVIAAQADCPAELSPHEYMAFSSLRSGPRLQWLNIARELSSPSLSFRREEVHTLITQAAWQLGPLADGKREWHIDLGIPCFGWTLLRELESLLEKIEANWLEEVTVRTIGTLSSKLRYSLPFVKRSVALITSRLLSSTNDSDIHQRAYELLRKARNVAYTWINELDSKLDMTEDEMSRTNLRRRLCTLAATCFATYNVSPEYIPRTLASDNDIAIAVHCAVIVLDNTPLILKGDHYLVRLLNRHSRLLLILEPFLRNYVQSNPLGFDQGLTSLWSGFRRKASSNWHVLPSPNARWISCVEKGGQKIHYNLLTGQLLMGGKPLGQLPQEIIEHPTYASALGAVSVSVILIDPNSRVSWRSFQRILDVVPADIPEMEFMTRSYLSGYQVRHGC